MKCRIIDKKICKKFIIDYLYYSDYKIISKMSGFNREKIRQSFNFHFPYIIRNRKNPKLLKILLTNNENGFYTFNVNNNGFIADKKYKKLIEALCIRDNGNGYLSFSYKGKTKYLHRLLCGEPVGLEVDHINICKYDNRESNLMACSRKYNALNRNSRGYFKIKERNLSKPYRVKIGHKYIGYYETQKEAKEVYNRIKKAKMLTL